MSRINSKQKGNSFEREVAKKLNEIFKNINIEGEFKRAPHSGAMMGGINAEINKNLPREAIRTLTSDLIVPSNFRFAIETKSYKEIDLYNLLTREKHIIWDWIKEVETTVGSEFDGWFIVAKANRKKWLLIANEDFGIKVNVKTNNAFTYKDLHIWPFDDFFKNVVLDRFLY